MKTKCKIWFTELPGYSVFALTGIKYVKQETLQKPS